MGAEVFVFFQAEDGIRGIGVTGVQTCALPICLTDVSTDWSVPFSSREDLKELTHKRSSIVSKGYRNDDEARSEERRVGKECRSRWAPGRKRKKKTERA